MAERLSVSEILARARSEPGEKAPAKEREEPKTVEQRAAEAPAGDRPMSAAEKIATIRGKSGGEVAAPKPRAMAKPGEEEGDRPLSAAEKVAAIRARAAEKKAGGNRRRRRARNGCRRLVRRSSRRGRSRLRQNRSPRGRRRPRPIGRRVAGWGGCRRGFWWLWRWGSGRRGRPGRRCRRWWNSGMGPDWRRGRWMLREPRTRGCFWFTGLWPMGRTGFMRFRRGARFWGAG